MTERICKRHGCGHYAALHTMGRCLAGSHADYLGDECGCWGWSP